MPLATDSKKYGADRSWPNTIVIGAPGVGNQLEWIPPANTVIQVVGVSFRMVALGAGTDRRPYVCMNTAGASTHHVNPIAIDQPTGASWTHYFSIGIAPIDLTSLSSLATVNPMTCAIRLVSSQDDRLCLRAINFIATDEFDNIRIRVNQWNED